MARQRAEASGRTPQQAEQAASDLAVIVGAGRLVVAPRKLPAELSACLGAALGEVLQSADFLQAAGRAQLSIQYQDSATAHQGLVAGERAVGQFRDLISAASRQVRE